MIGNVGETDIPVRVSDVVNKFESIGYNLGCIGCITGEDFGIRSTGTKIEINRRGIPTVSGGYSTTFKYDYTGDLIDELRKNFPDVFNIYDKMSNSETKYIYNSSRYSLDVMNGSMSLNLIRSENYTDTVNFSNVVQRCGGKDINAVVDLSIRYSTNGRIKAKRHVFSVLSEGKVNEFTTDINGEISVECLSGTVKAIPLTDNIDECIIDSCVVTYGRL